MQISERISRQILLFSLLALIVPMVIFPKRLGTELADFAIFNGVLEFVIYGFMLFFMSRKLPLVDLLKGAAACLVYRMGMGLFLGLLIAVMYQMSLSVAIALGMVKYLPAIILHIAVTPFILKPIIDRMTEVSVDKAESGFKANHSEDGNSSSTMTNIVLSKDKKSMPSSNTPVSSASEDFNDTGKLNQSGEEVTDGFEKAVKYIGEDGSVKIALVVDHEGLLLSNFNRSELPSDDIAPYAFSLLENNTQLLSRFGHEQPEKIEFTFNEKKIVVACETTYFLMVISERTIDDVLNIRINQGLEIIRKHISETYGNEFIGNVESIYV